MLYRHILYIPKATYCIVVKYSLRLDRLLYGTRAKYDDSRQHLKFALASPAQ